LIGSSAENLTDQDLRSELAAFQRAATEARKIAIQTNTGIIIRRDGQLVELSAADLIAEAAAKTATE
jgi:hypothetical protein